MGSSPELTPYTWEEVQRRCTREERWLVINRKVYDITTFCQRHPGGPRVISHYAGQDATVRGAIIIMGGYPGPTTRGAHFTYGGEHIFIHFIL